MLPTMTPPPRPPVDAPPRPWFIIGLTLVSALSAVGGGIELLLWPTGNAYLALELLEPTVFESFFVPGLVLAIVVGGTSLVAAVLALARSRATYDATILAGGTLTLWIAAEMALLRQPHWLHAIYGGIGLALWGLGIRGAWRGGLARHRWVVIVTLAEALGFLAPTLAALLAHRAGASESILAMSVVAAGFVEGLVLGAGQALAFPLPLRRLRYALLTSIGAGLVWASVMTTMALGSDSVQLPTAIIIAISGLTAMIGLVAIGGTQWLELRHHCARAHRWIAWTALAWVVALPMSFLPGPLVDESTPLGSHLVLWGCGGLLMAHVMALITWQGVRRLPALAP